MKILFVCRGNVGRSQMAEMIFKQLANGKHEVESAGTEAMGSDGTNLDGMLLKHRASSKHVIESLREIGKGQLSLFNLDLPDKIEFK